MSSFTSFEPTPGYKNRRDYDQPPQQLNHRLGVPGFPQRATRGGHFRKQLGFIPQLFSLKYNGWMCLVHYPSLTCWNRHGKRLTIESEFSDALRQLKHLMNDSNGISPGSYSEEKITGFEQWFVCEALSRRHQVDQGSLFVIDYIPTRDGILEGPDNSFANRHGTLESWSTRYSNTINPHNGCFPVHKWNTRIDCGENWWNLYWPRYECYDGEKGSIKSGTKQSLFLIDQFKATDDELMDIWKEIPKINEAWGCEYYEGFVATNTKSPYKLALSPNQSQTHIIKYRHDQ